MQRILITGVAGFIGFSLARALLRAADAPQAIVGVDSLDPYYSVELKKDRLKQLGASGRFRFSALDIADAEAMRGLIADERPDVVVHLAAQAGVRHSLDHPFAYAHSNLLGHLSVLEACRHAPQPPRLIYASSSSVYGKDSVMPFSEDEPASTPLSLYAATKRADELMSDSYAHLFGLEQIGLRFFTVYGPWGRPDMAYWTFTEKIIAGTPIPIFNNGLQKRDFTYVDDIVEGIVSCIAKAPNFVGDRPHRVYNIGSNEPVPLMHFIDVLEAVIGKPAIRDMQPRAQGDVDETCADITRISADYGYFPRTRIEAGLPKFVEWYRTYFGI